MMKPEEIKVPQGTEQGQGQQGQGQPGQGQGQPAQGGKPQNQ